MSSHRSRAAEVCVQLRMYEVYKRRGTGETVSIEAEAEMFGVRVQERGRRRIVNLQGVESIRRWQVVVTAVGGT